MSRTKSSATGGAQGPEAPQLIEGFAWPVPLAFAAAVSACRFEPGDVLYSDRSGYEAWRVGGPRPDHQLQILDPPRSGTRPAEAEGSRFEAGWDAAVTIEWTRRDAGERCVLTTTQGRVFTCLWHGDVAHLAPDVGTAPPPPALARALGRELDAAWPAFARAFAGVRGAAFVWVVDQASDPSRVKAHAISSVLARDFDVRSVDLTPAAAGVADGAGFHPALVLRGVAAAGATTSALEQTLKSLLYTPAAAADGKADRFKAARHGLLAALGPAES